MEKKSSGGGQGSGGQQKKPPAKPAAAAPKPAVFEGASANPRATLNGVAAVVMSGANNAKKGAEVDPKKVLNANVFSSGATVEERKSKLPSVWTGSSPDTEDEGSTETFDGTTPAEAVASPDLWKAIQPPVQSREGQRSPELYEQVINQFAVGHNPRYEPEAPDKPRAHIFVWDVTRAMNAEIPHMVGARELTLAQTLDWLRYEGSQRGWVRVLPETAIDAANQGRPVIVTPKQGVSKVAMMAIVRPGQVGPGGHPRVAAAGKGRGNDLSPQEALGVPAVEYFAHS